LRLPIVLRGQNLGWIAIRRNPEAQPWSPEEIELATSTVSQLALALENARLLEENRRRAQQEELLGNFSAKTQGLLDVESVLKVAVEEMGHSLGLAKVQIQLGNGNTNSVAAPQMMGLEKVD
jgi:GAF domain-containing protein